MWQVGPHLDHLVGRDSTAMGIVDYTSRIGADVLKSTYLRKTRQPHSQATFRQLRSRHATWVAIRHPWFVQRRSL
jgi:hypothetical protein